MRQRQVFDRSTVAHKWAHQTQGSAQDARKTFYFEGKTIYSYGSHFPIATHHNGKVLFTTDSYSKTTGGHINEVRSACSHIQKVYCNDPYRASIGQHEDNIMLFEKEAKEASDKLLNARKPVLYIEQIEKQKHIFFCYCEHFGLFAINKEVQTNVPLY